jgi:putative flippase GtrA
MFAPRPNERLGVWDSFSLMGVSASTGAAGAASSRQRGYPSWLWQALKFAAVGLSNTALDALLYAVLTNWLGFGGMLLAAKTLSYGTGIANSFYWNRSWTFRSTVRAAYTFLPFVVANLCALAINTGTMALGLSLFDQQQVPSFALAAVGSLLWNFTISKYLVFRR